MNRSVVPWEIRLVTALLLQISVSAIFSGHPLAQAEEIQEQRPDHIRKWSIQFAKSGFGLSSFKGSLLSVQRELSESTALRLGITSIGYIIDRDMPAKANPTQSLDSDADHGYLRVSATYLWNLTKVRDVELYCGVGPSVGYWRTKSVDEVAGDWGSRDDSQWRYRRTASAALEGILGIEYSPIPRLGITAEYQNELDYYYNEIMYHYPGSAGREPFTDIQITRRLGFDASFVRVGIAVYL